VAPPRPVNQSKPLGSPATRQPFKPPTSLDAANRPQPATALPPPVTVAPPVRQDASALPVGPVHLDPLPPPVSNPAANSTPPRSREPEPASKAAEAVIVEPKPISRPAPAMPALALQRGISGTVKLEALVNRDGTISEIKVLSGDPILAAAAKVAVSKWRFEPGTLNGRPISMKVPIGVVFNGRK
jgi:protein TonB